MNFLYPSFLSPELLADFPGAPFPWGVVKAVEASLRSDCNWHIAPVFGEVFTIEARHGKVLCLPSQRIVTIRSIKQGSQTISGWQIKAGGVVEGTWIAGQRYTVDLDHGWDLPWDLLAAAVARCQRLVHTQVIASSEDGMGPFTTRTTYDNAGNPGSGVNEAVDLYRVRRVQRY